jgi:predicted transcriptional regulator
MNKNKSQNSFPQLLRALWQEGVFGTAKTLAEINDELAARSFHNSSSSLAVALMRAVKKGFLIRKKDAGKWKYLQKKPLNSPSGQRIELFTRYDFHPQVKKVAFNQFQDGYFKEAIQNALVEVIDQVKIKANHPKGERNGRSYDLDGDDLMNHVFGCDNQLPLIKFNELRDSLDRTEQRGLMNLFKGTVGIRDKKAHLNYVQDDPLKTVEYLSLASLLLPSIG